MGRSSGPCGQDTSTHAGLLRVLLCVLRRVVLDNCRIGPSFRGAATSAPPPGGAARPSIIIARPSIITPPAVTNALATLASKYELLREEHARRIRYHSRERQIKEAKGDKEAAEEELDLGRPVEGKGPVGRRMVGEWRRMDQGVMLHDLEDLDNLAQRYRVLLAASQVVQRVVDECTTNCEPGRRHRTTLALGSSWLCG